MTTRKITKKEFKRLIKDKMFTNSKVHKFQAEINGKKIDFEKNCYHSILKDLFRHFTPEQITDVFPRCRRKHTPSYQKDDVLGIWLYAKPANETIKDIYKFIKDKNIRFNIFFILENDNNCIYNYSRKFKESTDNTPVDINNKGFEETKGEEATREAEMNEQCDKKNKWRIRRYNDKGIVIKETKVQFLNSLINNNNWPEIINKDTHYNIRKRPTKNLQNLNITIDELTKKNTTS